MLVSLLKTDDRLYQEVDDSCGLCGLRGTDLLTIHHIDGNRRHNAYENQIVLCHNCHSRYHSGKGITEAQIRTRKRHLIEKALTVHGVNALKIAARSKIGVAAAPFLLFHVVDLGYLKKEETISSYGGHGGEVEMEARFSITANGRSVLAEWLTG